MFDRCGPLTYTVDIISSKPGPYDSAITVKHEPTDIFASAKVTV